MSSQSHTMIRAQDDLYQSVNHEWLSENQIPDEYSCWNNFVALHDQSLNKLKQILEDLEDSVQKRQKRQKRQSSKNDFRKSHNRDLLRNLYSSGMDLERIEKNGLTDLQTLLHKFNQISDVSQLAALCNLMGIGSLFSISSEPDAKNSF